MKMFKQLATMGLLIAIVHTTFITSAQEDDQVTDATIADDQPVYDTITDHSFYDLWRFNATNGEIIAVTMVAEDGLAPLLGITDGTGDIIIRSDIDPDGEPLPDAEPNDTISIEFIVRETGRYTIVPTRAGNQGGTTTGSYTLTMQRRSDSSGRISDRPDVTFRCGDAIATNVVTLSFLASDHVETYRVRVYGLDDFQPVLRFSLVEGSVTQCLRDGSYAIGDRFILPGDDTAYDVTDSDTVVSHDLHGRSEFGMVEITVGSVDGKPGRFMLLVDGFELEEAGIRDFVRLTPGPMTIASEGELTLYMVAAADTRLDPELVLVAEEPGAEDIVCDDAGRRGCEDIPSFDGAGVTLVDGSTIIGNRFDAGLSFTSEDITTGGFMFRSRNRVTTGAYTVFVVGELPPRTP